MTQEEQFIINALIARDNRVTEEFFFTNCRPIFFAMLRGFFDGKANYNELINEVYLHLMKDGEKKLRTFGNSDNRLAIYEWIRTVAYNYFKEAKHRGYVEDCDSEEETIEKWDKKYGDMRNAMLDAVRSMIDMLEIERQRVIIQEHYLNGKTHNEIAEMLGLSPVTIQRADRAAIENLKKKMRIALDRDDKLCAVRCEQYVLDFFEIHRAVEVLQKIAVEKGWLDKEGVTADSIGRLSAYFGLDVKRTEGANLRDISDTLKAGRQVLVAVDGGELIGNPFEEFVEDRTVGQIADHCVVVLTCHPEEGRLSLYDPAFGDVPLTVTAEHFDDAWGDSGRYMVSVGERPSCK